MEACAFFFLARGWVCFAPARDGVVWRGLEGMRRQGAKGAKGRTPRGGLVLWAHLGPPIGPEVLRVWDHFCAPKSGDVGFAREKWGWIFLFFVGGGLRESGPGCAWGDPGGWVDRSRWFGGLLRGFEVWGLKFEVRVGVMASLDFCRKETKGQRSKGRRGGWCGEEPSH
jgi:hypothetical protein